jgi:hypothetical protein
MANTRPQRMANTGRGLPSATCHAGRSQRLAGHMARSIPSCVETSHTRHVRLAGHVMPTPCRPGISATGAVPTHYPRCPPRMGTPVQPAAALHAAECAGRLCSLAQSTPADSAGPCPTALGTQSCHQAARAARIGPSHLALHSRHCSVTALVQQSQA